MKQNFLDLAQIYLYIAFIILLTGFHCDQKLTGFENE